MNGKWAWWLDGDERFHVCESAEEAHSEAQRRNSAAAGRRSAGMTC
jgi:hypothetical protein